MMKLNELYNCNLDIEINGIKTNSKEVKKGDLFVCIKGFTNDGHEYINDALKNGAVAIISEKDINVNIPVIKVEDTKAELANLLDKFYGNPNNKFKFIGVTGTDGKTTTATVIYNFLNKIKKAAYIGTNGIASDNYTVDEVLNTTPDILEFYNILEKLSEDNVEYISMEASSAGLKQNRTGNIEFDFGVFTNLSIDHLKFHGSFEDYKHSKIKLFEKIKKDGFAILNIDDEYYEDFLSHCNCNVITYGKSEKADIRILNSDLSLNKTTFSILYKNNIYEIETSLIGDFNIYNICAAIAVATCIGVPIESCIECSKKLKILGRMEKVKFGQDFTIIFDFGHTINSLKSVLSYLKNFNKNRIIIVFGAVSNFESDRKEKGNIITSMADYTIFTSDKRADKKVLENQEDIINEITSDAIKPKFEVCIDRKEAIRKAISIANKDDIVLISGVEYFVGKNRKTGVNPYLECQKALEEKQK